MTTKARKCYCGEGFTHDRVGVRLLSHASLLREAFSGSPKSWTVPSSGLLVIMLAYPMIFVCDVTVSPLEYELLKAEAILLSSWILSAQGLAQSRHSIDACGYE